MKEPLDGQRSSVFLMGLPHIADVKKGGSGQPDFNESRLHARKHFSDHA